MTSPDGDAMLMSSMIAFRSKNGDLTTENLLRVRSNIIDLATDSHSKVSHRRVNGEQFELTLFSNGDDFTMFRFSWAIPMWIGILSTTLLAAETRSFDVVIYGGTSAGVSAAIQSSRMGKSVVIIEPFQHLGGLTISGLGMTDSGNKAVIGGIAREFYQRIKKHYDANSAWTQEKRDGYKRYRADDDAMWTFEPHVAENTFKKMLAESKVTISLGEGLDRQHGVKMNDGRIVSITMKSGQTYRGKCFIDATYEGDLMAAAGVSYHVGREANSTYGETLNGVQIAHSVYHQFIKPVDPYLEPGNPASGLLPGINTHPGTDGEGDHRVQAYNYRVCLTDVPENQVPFTPPPESQKQWHELLLRNCEAGDPRLPLSLGMMPNRKTDLNNNFAVSTDWIGMNYDYPNADDETRRQILKDHQDYVRGFLWTLANHPRVPEAIRKRAGRWGYAKDEFKDNNNFPYWCYIREARRMVSDYVQTELDCRRIRVCEDSVGLGSYNMDSHNAQRYVDESGHVQNEGDVQVSPRGPYLISYRAIVPKQEQCKNLLVPVCLSASHIAYGSIRMEPVFMILGQSAATAACLSIDAGEPVQNVEYALLREQLLKDKQVLDLPAGMAAYLEVDISKLEGMILDDSDAKKIGEWSTGHSIGSYLGHSYLHDSNEGKGKKSVIFTFQVEEAGTYHVGMSYTPHGNRATNVPVTISTDKTTQVVTVNEKKAIPDKKLFLNIGKVTLPKNGEVTVTVSNKGTNGHVIVDGIRLLKQ